MVSDPRLSLMVSDPWFSLMVWDRWFSPMLSDPLLSRMVSDQWLSLMVCGLGSLLCFLTLDVGSEEEGSGGMRVAIE